MNGTAHQLPSVHMARKMFLWQFGHFGPPVLVFPSASGMAHEWERHGMIDTLGDLLAGGRIKLYCVESNVAEAWTRRENDPAWRISRHMAYERFVVEELVPFIRHDCRSKTIPIATTGTSLGAYYAANFALKFPEIFNYALCLSGRYDISEFAGGLANQDVYFNNPMWYVPNLSGAVLDRVRGNTHVALVCGRGQWENGNHEEATRLAGMLADKGIPHECDLWGFDVAHEWPWWQKQARLHLGRRFDR
jgi:esterase/lipase superfamily enzyme